MMKFNNAEALITNPDKINLLKTGMLGSSQATVPLPKATKCKHEGYRMRNNFSINKNIYSVKNNQFDNITYNNFTIN